MAINERDEFYQAGGAIDFTRPTRFRAPVNILDRIEFNAEVTGDNSQHFSEIAGTLPPSPSLNPQGIFWDITSAGNKNIGQEAAALYFRPGFTGAGYTVAWNIQNFVAGTNTNLFIDGNMGSAGIASSVTTGSNTGATGFAAGGDINAGSSGIATTSKANAKNIGVAGFAQNDGANGVEVGVYAGLNISNPTFESAGLLADNAGRTSPIALYRDNGVVVAGLYDGGSEQGKMGTKTLTEGAATGFVQISVPTGTTVGGFIKYTIEANDGTDFQARSGILPFAAVNKAGTETGAVATVSTATETVAVSAGTLTNTFDIDTSPANAINIRANATSSLAQTTLRISYRVEMYSNAVVTVTPL